MEIWKSTFFDLAMMGVVVLKRAEARRRNEGHPVGSCKDKDGEAREHEYLQESMRSTQSPQRL